MEKRKYYPGERVKVGKEDLINGMILHRSRLFTTPVSYEYLVMVEIEGKKRSYWFKEDEITK